MSYEESMVQLMLFILSQNKSTLKKVLSQACCLEIR